MSPSRPLAMFAVSAALLVTFAAGIRAEVITYPAPADVRYTSGRYSITVSPTGDRTAPLASFVYQSQNPFTRNHQLIGRSNHWTTFSFSGSVTVTVTAHDRAAIRSCVIRPTAYGIPAEVAGRTVRFTLDRPRQVCVELDGERTDPLFVFAKELETDLPDLTGTNVIDFGRNPAVHNDPKKPNILYFPPGEYDLVAMGYDRHHGFPLDAGDIVYLAGGAIVHGCFGSTGERVTVRGRGIISGAKWRWVRQRYEEANIPWSYAKYREIAVYLHGGGHNVIEGITITDPVHFCTSVADDSTVRGIQCFGWWYTTDGVFAGERSVVEDCFFKVNDDIIKVYSTDMQVRRCVIWQQNNGAPFQFSWNHTTPVHGIRVSDCIIMASEVTADRPLMGNRSVFNCRLNQGAALSDYRFENIRIEGDIYRLLGLNIGEAGSIRGVTLRNIEVTGRIQYFNYLNATAGRISDIAIENLTVAGSPVRTLDEFIVVTRGDVSGVTIQ